MASGMSAYLAAALLDHVLGRTTYTAPATVYVALSTAAFDPTLDGTSVVEPVGHAYARVAVTNNTTEWPDASGVYPTVKATANDVTFPTATGSWGTIHSGYVTDDPAAGNVLFGADLTPFSVATGPGPVLAGGDLATNLRSTA